MCIRAPAGTHQLHAAAPALALAGGDEHLLLVKLEEGVLPPVVLLHARLLLVCAGMGVGACVARSERRRALPIYAT